MSFLRAVEPWDCPTILSSRVEALYHCGSLLEAEMDDDELYAGEEEPTTSDDDEDLSGLVAAAQEACSETLLPSLASIDRSRNSSRLREFVFVMSVCVPHRGVPGLRYNC